MYALSVSYCHECFIRWDNCVNCHHVSKFDTENLLPKILNLKITVPSISNELSITMVVSDHVDILYLSQNHHCTPDMQIFRVYRTTTDLKLNLGGTISPCGGKRQLWLAGCGPTGQINTRKETLGLLMSPWWRRKMKYSMSRERWPQFDCARIALWHGYAFRITNPLCGNSTCFPHTTVQ